MKYSRDLPNKTSIIIMVGFPFWKFHIANENHQWYYRQIIYKWVIFHSYVK